MDEEPEATLTLRCQVCGGRGLLTVQGPQEGQVHTSTCQPCTGSGLVKVRPADARLRLLLPDGSPRGLREMLVVDHSGRLQLGEPMDRDEQRHAAAVVNHGNFQLLATTFAFSELARLQQEVQALRAELARVKGQVVESRVDAAAVRMDLRKAGLVRDEG